MRKQCPQNEGKENKKPAVCPKSQVYSSLWRGSLAYPKDTERFLKIHALLVFAKFSRYPFACKWIHEVSTLTFPVLCPFKSLFVWLLRYVHFCVSRLIPIKRNLV